MVPQMDQFPGQPHLSQLVGQQYYIQHQPMAQYYNVPMPGGSQQHQAGLQMPSVGMSMGYYASSSGLNQSQSPVPAPAYYYPLSNHYPTLNPAMSHTQAQPQFFLPDGPSRSQASSSLHKDTDGGGQSRFVPSEGPSSSGTRSGVVRGPPRKPRQTGHAIWIGNLPPQTDLMTLVQHVCKETTGLESLFLISKSNCAFANFKDETTCSMAQQKLHESKFQSVRLVSRLRKSTVEGASGRTAPIGPASASSSSHPTPANKKASSPANAPGAASEDGVQLNAISNETGQPKDKFFILKSLTVEDLELSTRNGVWATQAHNEEALNKAFKEADNVYLIFSANKSGEYFGYARMTSPINDDPSAAIEFAPKAQATHGADVPKAIPTEATETCPRGRIIDDSARGTIFWEVERDEEDEALDTVSEHSAADSAKSAQEGEGEESTNVWGRPFKLQWLSTTRLPFYRTRGLRNPWNNHREVKIARDGTELETTVGAKLVGLFNRMLQSPTSSSVPAMMGLPMPGTATNTTGYPPPMSPPHFRR
ncbi:hypothetical protein F5Y17DRAFT_425162 [Xylariaceae sp. FL0594]|nr:hypothetical protein F5Y17DRAFT_425162 [Xylariaceae sp. FL0594]